LHLGAWRRWAKHPWLNGRGSVYYLRAPVPKDIRDIFGKT